MEVQNKLTFHSLVCPETWGELYCRLKEYCSRRVILVSLALFVSLTSTIVAFQMTMGYLRYAAIVDARLADQSLQQPPGIYAAPRYVHVGLRLTPDELTERLLRAGYLTSEGASDFAAGNFRQQAESVEIYTSNFAQSQATPARIRIHFGKAGITEIENAVTGEHLQSILLPAEMLVTDFNTKKQARRALNFADLPEKLIKALCAIEDQRFFSHRGIDLIGIIRAAFTNLRHRKICEGGSTITQQLVKNEFLSSERTWERKFAEAAMAVALERRLTKQQILALYCERVYLGHSGLTAIYGFQQAAQIYFGKELDDLTVAEAALLAGLVKAPNLYSPYSNPDEAKARRDRVLEAMTEAGSLSAQEAAQSKTAQLTLLPPQKLDHSAAPYFVDYIQRELDKHLSEEESRARLRVETTLDLDLQQAANEVVAQHVSRLSKLAARQDGAHPEIALVAIDPQSGQILAMVGGSDYATSQLNRVTDAMRQPGSVFKPIIYATALASGISPATTFANAPHEIEFGYRAVYRPQNFRQSYSNQPVTLREALVRSLNIVAVDAAMQVGLNNVANMAEKMGLPRPANYPSMALGAFEATPLAIASAYTTFANSGLRVDPVAIRAIQQNNTELFSGETQKTAVLAASTAYLVTDALSDVVNRGTGARVRQMGYHGPAAGKTGTSRDAWFVGYTPKLMVVVWVGFDDNRDLKLTGGEAAAPIWADFVKRALTVRPDLTAKEFTLPGGLEIVEIDPDTGALANEYCPHRQRMLISSYLIPTPCFAHQAPVVTEEVGERAEPASPQLPLTETSDTNLDLLLRLVTKPPEKPPR